MHRLGPGSVVTAAFGSNKFLVTYPDVLRDGFPHHVTNATMHGRLIGTHTIVNVDISLVHDDVVSRSWLRESHLFSCCSVESA